MGFFKKPVAQIDNDEQIRREIRARVAKQVGIYDEEYINTGKIGGTKNAETPVDDSANVQADAEVPDVDNLVPEGASSEADVAEVDVEAVAASEADVAAESALEADVEAEAAFEALEQINQEIATEPIEIKKTLKENPPTKKKKSTPEKNTMKEKKPQIEHKPAKEEKPQIEQKPTKEEKPQIEQKSTKEEKPQIIQKPPKEKNPPKQKKPSKKKKTNIALILFFVVLILAFIPLYYFLTGGNIQGPQLKISSQDMTLFLTEPLVVRGMVSDSDNSDGMKVYYSLDNGSASLLYTFKEGPGPFENEIELPDTADYLGEHSVTLYAENPSGELSKATILNYNVVKPGLAGIEIITQPSKVSYVERETLDLTGLVVSASYEDGKTAVISEYTSDVPAGTKLSKIGEIAITISYFEDEITKTATFNISVRRAPIEMPSKKANGIYAVPAMIE